MNNYEKIIKAAYKRGFEDACSHYIVVPQPPYKRADYREAWAKGFTDTTRNITQAIERLTKQPKALVDDNESVSSLD